MYKKIYSSILFRFLLVGVFGVVSNLFIFYIFSDILAVNPYVSAVLAFLVAVSQNYVLNHFWGFKEIVDYALSLKAYLKYITVNIFGLLVNLFVLKIIIHYFSLEPKVLAQFFAIGCGTILNYFGAKKVVFKKNV